MPCPLAEMVPLLAVEHEIGVLMNRLGDRGITLNRNITPYLAAAQNRHAQQRAQQDEDALNTSTLTAVEPEAQEDLNTSTLTAVEPESEDALNTSTLTAVELDIEDGLNTSTMTAIEPDTQDQLDTSVLTALEPEEQNDLNASSLSAFELDEDELNTSTLTAVEPEEDVMNSSTATALEPEQATSSSTSSGEIVDLDKHQENCARRWMKQLDFIRKNPNADHTAGLKVMLDEMKSTWF